MANVGPSPFYTTWSSFLAAFFSLLCRDGRADGRGVTLNSHICQVWKTKNGREKKKALVALLPFFLLLPIPLKKKKREHIEGATLERKGGGGGGRQATWNKRRGGGGGGAFKFPYTNTAHDGRPARKRKKEGPPTITTLFNFLCCSVF